MDGFSRFTFSFFNTKVMFEYVPYLLEGLVVTILLSILIVLSGLSLGFLLALLRTMGFRAVNLLIVCVVDVIRSIPPLVIIILLFFGLPSAGISISGFVAVWLALAAVLMAFSEEIFWAGITAVEKGQWEAARSTGLTFFQALIHAVVPQAMRLAIPPLTNRTIAIIKGTALATVVGVNDILGAAQSSTSFAANPSPLTMAAIMYVFLFVPIVVAGRWIETRFSWKK